MRTSSITIALAVVAGVGSLTAQDPVATSSPADAALAVSEQPEGWILYNSHRGRVVSMWGVEMGGQPHRLKIFRTPRWAPDGERVLVSYFGTSDRFELGVTRPQGGDVTDVAASPDHDSIQGNWSPAGDRIVYVQRKDNRGEIATIGVDGTGARVLAPHPADDAEPTWSPDGETIAFASRRGTDKKSAIYAVPVDGGEVRRVTEERADCGQPAFAPDGDHLAYVVRYRSEATRKWVCDLRVLELDGGESRVLVEGVEQIVGVDWSPRGQWLVFGCTDEGQSDLCVVGVDGGGYRKVTDDPHGDSHPSWQPLTPGRATPGR